MEVYHKTGGDSEGGGGASAEVLKALISSAKEEPSLLKSPETAGTLAMEIGKKLCDLLLQPHDDVNLNLPSTGQPRIGLVDRSRAARLVETGVRI